MGVATLNRTVNRLNFAMQGLGAGGGNFIQRAAFLLNFDDLGAGVVSTTAARGGVAPTFTRATGATTIGSTGLVVTSASGSPRSYYDPTTLTYLGYLAEGARTNLLLRSQEFDNASWATSVDVTITADNTTSPDGTANADRIVEGTAGTALKGQAVTATADVNYSTSIWIKRSNIQWVFLDIFNGGNFVVGWFDIQNGVIGTSQVGGTGSFVRSSIKSYPNGWYRLELVGSVGSAATAITFAFASANADNSLTRVNNAAYFVYGAQFENNVSFASSYIPTTTGTVTRNADVLTYPTTGWLNAAAGTLFAQGTSAISSSGNQGYVLLNDTTANEYIYIFRANGGNATYQVADGGALQVNSNTGALANNASLKGAFAYTANDFAFCTNAGSVGTDTSGTLPALTRLDVGAFEGTEFSFSPIRRIAYWPQRLSNANLQAITS